jgi:O-acetyl-ADP-ribose deacetylase (regulator of RNase III)
MEMLPDRIKIEFGDITQLEVDAIVNAANTSLLGGGGVDGAIHKAAGPELLEYCRNLKGCVTGEAKITPGFKLPAKYIIHTPGPIWREGRANEDVLLANCYKNSLKLAVENNIKTIAFPAISTGVYGFPVKRAANIALDEATTFLSKNKKIEKIIFICYDITTFDVYKRITGGYD